ncbi:hypothetical protein TNCV_1537451 [Trichonephila clavipes]|nr:hypothetical protein TNCV_1537451 [Trichonephila clavipes]
MGPVSKFLLVPFLGRHNFLLVLAYTFWGPVLLIRLIYASASDYLLFRSTRLSLSEKYPTSYVKISEIGLIRGKPQKIERSPNAISVCCQKDGEKQ